MNKTKILLVAIVILVLSFLSFKNLTDSMGQNTQAPEVNVPNIPDGTACTADAKICPDGTAVGRTGPKCEFMACPSPNSTQATVTTYLDRTVTSLNLTISPKEIVSDSRCPLDVQCVWAGTVEVRTQVSFKSFQSEKTFMLGDPQNVGDFVVTLTDITPNATAGKIIPVSSYQFTYQIKKN